MALARRFGVVLAIPFCERAANSRDMVSRREMGSSNSPTWGLSPGGPVAAFNGTTTDINVGRVAGFSLVADFSLYTRVRFTSLTSPDTLQTIVSQRDTVGDPGRDFQLSYYSSIDRIAFFLFGGGTAVELDANTFGAVPTNTSLDVFVTNVALTSTLTLSVNGLSDTATYGFAPNDASQFHVGNNVAASLQFLNGDMSQIIVGNRAWLPAEQTWLRRNPWELYRKPDLRYGHLIMAAAVQRIMAQNRIMGLNGLRRAA